MRPTERVAKAIVDAALLGPELSSSEMKHKKLEAEEDDLPGKRLKIEDCLQTKNKVKLENDDRIHSESPPDAKRTEDVLQQAEPKTDDDKIEPEIKTLD